MAELKSFRERYEQETGNRGTFSLRSNSYGNQFFTKFEIPNNNPTHLSLQLITVAITLFIHWLFYIIVISEAPLLCLFISCACGCSRAIINKTILLSLEKRDGTAFHLLRLTCTHADHCNQRNIPGTDNEIVSPLFLVHISPKKKKSLPRCKDLYIFCLFRLLVLGFGCSSVNGLLDLLSSLFYVIRQFDRFLHGGWTQKNQKSYF